MTNLPGDKGYVNADDWFSQVEALSPEQIERIYPAVVPQSKVKPLKPALTPAQDLRRSELHGYLLIAAIMVPPFAVFLGLLVALVLQGNRMYSGAYQWADTQSHPTRIVSCYRDEWEQKFCFVKQQGQSGQALISEQGGDWAVATSTIRELQEQSQ